jgi:hypothetical protein
MKSLICADCQTENPDYLLLCRKCGHDLPDVHMEAGDTAQVDLAPLSLLMETLVFVDTPHDIVLQCGTEVIYTMKKGDLRHWG